ncbi:MAG TPA: o-succinylbenzoate synthase [Acidimicrobiales bacterium]
MEVEAVELRRVRVPLVAPFRTSFGVERERDVLLVRVLTADGEGWGECVAMSEPAYSAEYAEGAHHVVRTHLLPRLLASAKDVVAEDVAAILGGVKGHPMAKAAIETAVLDAQLRASGTPLAAYLGGVRDAVDAGVSVGIASSVDELLDVVAGYLDDGYRRVKLKIEPGWDVEPVRATRERFGDELLLQVDANGAYGEADIPHLARLEPFDLLLIEQPFAEDDLTAHTALAAALVTPVCLDESIVSEASMRAAIAMAACDVVNIKAARVGGHLEARRIHDLCAAHQIPVWCGGMLETGIGRAANVALATLSNFTLPGDLSASARYFEEDLTEPFVLDDGRLRVPSGPGIGVQPIRDVLDAATTSLETFAP